MNRFQIHLVGCGAENKRKTKEIAGWTHQVCGLLSDEKFLEIRLEFLADKIKDLQAERPLRGLNGRSVLI